MDRLPGEGVPPLDSFSKEEWRDVARGLDRHYSDEKFDRDWADFVAKKARRELS